MAQSRSTTIVPLSRGSLFLSEQSRDRLPELLKLEADPAEEFWHEMSGDDPSLLQSMAPRQSQASALLHETAGTLPCCGQPGQPPLYLTLYYRRHADLNGADLGGGSVSQDRSGDLALNWQLVDHPDGGKWEV